MANNTLQNLLAQNAQLLKHAEAGDWECVSDAAAERQRQIERFYQKGGRQYHASVLENATRELLRVNERLTELAMQARGEAQAALASLGQGRRAVDAYHEVGS